MTDVLLNQAIGVSGLGPVREVGDIIETARSKGANGNVYLECSGAIINPSIWPGLAEYLSETLIAGDEVSRGASYCKQWSISSDERFVVGAHSYDGFGHYSITDTHGSVTDENGESETIIYTSIKVSGDGSLIVASWVNADDVVCLSVLETASGGTLTSQPVIALTESVELSDLAIGISKDGDKIVIIATKNHSNKELLICSSMDRGVSWDENVVTVSESAIPVDVVHNDDMSKILLNTTTGYYITNDIGATWSNETYSPMGLKFTTIDIIPGTDYLCAFTISPDKLYRSDDFGVSWDLILSSSYNTSMYTSQDFMSVALAPDMTIVLMTACSYTIGNHVKRHNVFKVSKDLGITWTENIYPDNSLIPALGSRAFFNETNNRIYYTSKGTNAYMSVYYLDMFNGIALPYYPGKKIVADVK